MKTERSDFRCSVCCPKSLNVQNLNVLKSELAFVLISALSRFWTLDFQHTLYLQCTFYERVKKEMIHFYCLEIAAIFHAYTFLHPHSSGTGHCVQTCLKQ